MPQYEVYATWEYSEKRVITAKNEREALKKIANGEYDTILDSGQFGDYIGYESIVKIEKK